MTIPDDPQAQARPRTGPAVWLALVLIAGALAGYSMTFGAWWLIAAMLFLSLGIAAFFLHRRRLANVSSLIAAMLAMACWSDLNHHWTNEHDLSRVMASSTDSRLAIVTGRINGLIKLVPPPQEGLARYQGWQPTGANFLLSVDGVNLSDRTQPVSGRLIVRARHGEPVPESWRPGAKVRLTGWLSPLEGPRNPGETDWRTMLQRRGIDGRFYVESWDTTALLQPPGGIDRLASMRDRLSDFLSRSLDLGQPVAGPSTATRRAFLQAILLGRYQKELRPLQEDFRQTGLVHILTISGAHLAMFTAMIWWVMRFFPMHPRTMALLTLMVLLGYVLALPAQVAVIRSAIMAGFLLWGYASGRSVAAIDWLALAAILVLIADPLQAVDPGAQLSFAITAGLILFTRPLADHWIAATLATGATPNRTQRIKRFAAEILAANVVGFVIACPLVAFHFGMVNALAVLLSILSMPLAWATLALGYLKILLGLIWPSVGWLLAWPTNLAADAMTGLVSMASRWPGASIRLESSAGLIWTLTALAIGLLWLSGGLEHSQPIRIVWLGCVGAGLCRSPQGGATMSTASSALGGATSAPGWSRRQPKRYDWIVHALAKWRPFRRRFVWLSILLLLGGWLYVDTQKSSIYAWPSNQSTKEAPLQARLTMLSVGDGSCYLLQWRDPVSSSKQTWMFDCGSSWLDGLVEQQIAAALQAIGVDRIDTLVLSHVDLDHIGGSVELAGRIPVNRLLVNSAFLAHAQWHEQGPAAMVIQQFRQGASRVHRPVIETADEGWQQQLSGLTIRMLHPPKEWVTDSKKIATNDQSLVMSVQSDRWRLILNGDIQQPAISWLLKQKVDLKADVIDLPHHGSFVRSSLDWLSACDPKIVLQSCGPARLRSDPWARPLDSKVRLVTHRQGMVQVDFMLDGSLKHRSFLPGNASESIGSSMAPNGQAIDERVWE